MLVYRVGEADLLPRLCAFLGVPPSSCPKEEFPAANSRDSLVVIRRVLTVVGYAWPALLLVPLGALYVVGKLCGLALRHTPGPKAKLA